MEVVDIHGAGGDVRGHGLEILVREELGLDLGGKDLGVLLKERNNNGVIIFLHVLLLKLELSVEVDEEELIKCTKSKR